MAMVNLKKLIHDRSGNFGMLTAILLVPVAGVAGLTIDFTQALQVRSKLQDAGDAAVLAALTSTSPGMQSIFAMNKDGENLVADQDAKSFFKGQLGGNTGYTLNTVGAQVVKTGNEVTATVSFQANVPTTLSEVMGWNQIPVAGHATAQITLQTYRDFYLLLDNTPSMGVGATTADIATMVTHTPDQCAFACHVVNNGYDDPNSYYNLAKRLGVTTRIDVVAQATATLMDTANAYRQSQNQYHMAVYTFGQSADNLNLYQVVAPTTNLTSAKKSASKIDLMTVPYQGYNNDQDTSFDTALSQLPQKMGLPGDGSSPASPQKIIYMVSDGVGDSYKPSNCTEKTTGGRCQEPIDTRLCDALKTQGYKIAILYTTYLALPTNAWYNTWIAPFQSQIGPRMQACASPGLYFEVSPTQGISDAMSTLFKKIVSTPRVTS